MLFKEHVIVTGKVMNRLEVLDGLRSIHDIVNV
jgi:hypothetical protein